MTTSSYAFEQRLQPCPASPNCVSSQADDSHQITPFIFRGTPEAAWLALIDTLKSTKRVAIITQTDTQLHATQTSLVFRFVDDLTFLLDVENHRIEVRSASRVGYSDFGVNRRRVEKLRQKLQTQGILDNTP